MEKSKETLRVRGTNFSKEEELNLLKIISKYKHIIECKDTDKVRPSEKDEAWQNIAVQYNSFNTRRSTGQLKSKFDNLKTAARKHASNCNRSLYSTGGGPPESAESKNIIYDEVCEILNKKTVRGLTNIYDDDFIEEKPEEVTEIINIGQCLFCTFIDDLCFASWLQNFI